MKVFRDHLTVLMKWACISTGCTDTVPQCPDCVNVLLDLFCTRTASSITTFIFSLIALSFSRLGDRGWLLILRSSRKKPIQNKFLSPRAHDEFCPTISMELMHYASGQIEFVIVGRSNLENISKSKAWDSRGSERADDENNKIGFYLGKLELVFSPRFFLGGGRTPARPVVGEKRREEKRW